MNKADQLSHWQTVYTISLVNAYCKPRQDVCTSTNTKANKPLYSTTSVVSPSS